MEVMSCIDNFVEFVTWYIDCTGIFLQHMPWENIVSSVQWPWEVTGNS